jgi:DNA-binding response OmpR family regulator
MTARDLLEGKRILLVDDEPDVLATLADLLSTCETVKASDFKAAKDYLETEYFDLAILDIMGVEGYQLLEIANQRRVMAVMLTARVPVAGNCQSKKGHGCDADGACPQP